MKRTLAFIIFISSLLYNCSTKDNKEKSSRAQFMEKRDSISTASKSNQEIQKRFNNLNFNEVIAEGSKLVLKNKTSFETKLFDLSYIGNLKTEKKLPYFIFSGRSCMDCDENISIYIWSPSDAAFEPTSHQWKYSYPGKETDYESNQLVFESAMYYGTCLGPDSCIWVQKQRTEDQLWKKSIFILTVKNDNLAETLVTKASEIQRLERKLSDCTELPGRDITSEP